MTTDYTKIQDPILLYQSWFEDAVQSGKFRNPDAAVLSTVRDDGYPDARTLLIREVDADGFVFFTNGESDKGQQLLSHPKAALTWYWEALGRQARAIGDVEVVTPAQSDRYFARRPRGSQIGAWASSQSRPISGRDELVNQVTKYESKYDGKAVPRPQHWQGYRVRPFRMEFWIEQEYRLHDRHIYQLDSGSWLYSVIAP